MSRGEKDGPEPAQKGPMSAYLVGSAQAIFVALWPTL
jgi:hypothetical protein